MFYKPKEPFTTVLELYNPTYAMVKGVTTKVYSQSPTDIINCSFKTYGGTESTVNDVYSLIDTANIETWYRPDITAASRFKLGNKVYEVIGEPEDISQRHQYLRFKIRGVRGGT